MSQIVDDLRQVAIEIKTETQVGGNTAARVGGAFERVADALEGTQQIEDMDAAVAAVQQAAQENEQTIQDIVNSLAVVQVKGQSTSAVMSQKAVTEALSEKQNTSEGTYIFCTKTPLNVSSPSIKNYKNYGDGTDIWYPAGASEYICYYEVTAYDKIDVNNISNTTLKYFLTTKIGSSNGERVAYAGGYKSIAVLPANDSHTIAIPDEEHVYLVFVQVANTVKNSITMSGYKYQSGNVSKTPSADVGVNSKTLDLEDEEIRIDIADLNDRVSERKIHKIDVYAYQQTNLPNGSSWSQFLGPSGHRGILIPLSENDDRLIKLCATNGNILYTFLTSNDVNVAPAYASEYSGLVTLSQGRKITIKIPSNALYFCLKTRDHVSKDLRGTYDAYFLSQGWETLDEKDNRWGIDAWEGKNVCVLGDSISAGVKTGKSFVSYLKDYFNLNISNYAIAGAMWTYVDNSSPEYVHKDILTQAQTALASGISFDAIIIYAGINDFLNSIQLGDWYTISTETVYVGNRYVTRQKRTLTTDKFQGSINTAMSYIKSNFPYAQVILVTPLHFGVVGYKNGTASASEMYANANGNYIDEFVKAIRDASDIWCCPLVDLYKDSGMSATINSHAQAYYNYVSEQTLQMTDILHPKKLGHFRMARIIRNKLLSLGCGMYNNADIDSQL